jgi:hypothetical protein
MKRAASEWLFAVGDRMKAAAPSGGAWTYSARGIVE